MRFLHLADLHLGKSIHGVSLLENGDQPAWVDRFLALTGKLRPDAVLVAGDVYDRSAPSEEAVGLLDRLLTGLAEQGIPVMLVAGNHDSGRRLAFGRSLLEKQKIHIAGVLSPQLPSVTLSDGYGPVRFWLMPYVFPALAAHHLGDETIRDYDTAVRRLLAAQKLDPKQRNVLVAHQNVVANGQEAVRGGSESMVGGVGQVDYTAFDGFDYVALGHIHSAYPVGRETVRYAGSPLCYHFTEARQPAKGPLLVELGPKGAAPVISTQVIEPLHPMRELRGAYNALYEAERQNTDREEYLRVVLTDCRRSPERELALRSLFEARGSVLMELVSEYAPFAAVSSAAPLRETMEEAVEELFAQFYRQRRNGEAPDEAERALLGFVGEQVRHAQGRDTLEQQAKALLEFAKKQEGKG